MIVNGFVLVGILLHVIIGADLTSDINSWGGKEQIDRHTFE